MLPNHFEPRRPPGEPIESDAGQKIDNRPQSCLSESPAERRKKDRQERLSDPLRRIREQRRRGCDHAAQRKQSVRTGRTRQLVDTDPADQDQNCLADEPQDQRASDGDLRRKGQLSVRRDRSPKFRHVPVGADTHQQVEHEGDRDEAQRLDEPQSAKATDEREDRTADVND